MNILFANPACRKKLDNKYEKYSFGAGCRAAWSLVKKEKEYPRFAMFPFFMAYSAALLEKKGFDVKVVDGVPLNLEDKEFIENCAAASPDLIVFEPATVNYNCLLKVSIDLYRITGAKIVFAGPHVSCCVHEILEQNEHIYAVMIGEYERTLMELLMLIRDNQDYSELKGVAYKKKGGEIIVNGNAEILADLDFLPLPARHLFPSYFNNNIALYHDGFCQNRPAIQMHSSRGCSFNCSYCLWNQALFVHSGQRRFSVDRIVREMKHIVERYGAREIYFDDDDFTQNRDHVIDLCIKIKAAGIKVPWSVMGDIYTIDNDMLSIMADAGCIGMKFGIESVDESVLRGIRKPADLKRVEFLIQKMRRLNIKSHMTIMFGLPGETVEGMNRTFEFACSLDLDSVQFHIAMPYPGTSLFTTLKNNGKLKTEEWENYDAAGKAVYKIDGINDDYLEQFRISAYGKWLRKKVSDPVWMMHQVPQMIRIVRGQGVGGVKKRLIRALEIIKK